MYNTEQLRITKIKKNYNVQEGISTDIIMFVNKSPTSQTRNRVKPTRHLVTIIIPYTMYTAGLCVWLCLFIIMWLKNWLFGCT